MALKRDVFNDLNKNLNTDEVLLVVGPRQVGKTTVLHQVESKLRQKEEKTYFLNLEDPDYLGLLNKSPKKIFDIFPINLKFRNYLLIDEIQYLANPSNFLKYMFDEYRGKVKILASGSSAFYLDTKFKDSLAGRKKLFTIYSLGFREFLKFKSKANLAKKDFSKLALQEQEKLQLLFLEYIRWGGYPRVILTDNETEKREILSELIYSYVKKDIFDANIKQDEDFYKLFKILANQAGNLVNSMELSKTLGLSKTSIDNYLSVMQKSLHIKLVRPFYKNIRKELTKMPKVYFTDLGLRNFLKNDFRLFWQRDDKGQVLENAVFRQLLDKYGADKIRFWRTTTAKEVDFVIEDEKLAYEVKTDLKNIKKSKYKSFSNQYTDFNLKFVSLKQVWQMA